MILDNNSFRLRIFSSIPAKYIYIILLTVLLGSCSSKPTEEKKQEGNDFLKSEAPKQDLMKVDAKAPVMKVVLTATGNTMADMLFDKDTIIINKNHTVEFELVNASKDQSMQHNFLIVEDGTLQKVADAAVKAGIEKNFTPEMDEVLIASSLTGPGQKTSLRFSAPLPGTYEFLCSYPGHYARMKGIVIVQ